MTTLWLLVFLAGHSYGTVPGITSEAECHRLAEELKRTRWAQTRAFASEDHRCLPYQGVVR